MEIISGDSISKKCDYSFGDQAGVLMGIPGAFMKKANGSNREFINFCKGKTHITLFIDNIRLYIRPIKYAPQDEYWVTQLQKEDLLRLVSQIPCEFTIYTSHEDTPVDEYIEVPNNVRKIYATNAVFNNDRIIPFPYGLQRKMNEEDNRIEIMKEEIRSQESPTHWVKYIPRKLLYINCGLGSERNAPERAYLPHFEQYEWATCRFNKDTMHFPYSQYGAFLKEMRDHKFMICPQGHGIDCHRNWELLYMRRVPVMKKSPYFTRLMQGFPVLFVERWEDVTRGLLEANNHLYEEALLMDLSKLDLTKYEAH